LASKIAAEEQRAILKNGMFALGGRQAPGGKYGAHRKAKPAR
jgi:hypothetical protein